MSILFVTSILLIGLVGTDGTSPQCRLKEEDIDFLRGAIQEAFKAEENPVEVIKEQMTIVNSFLNSQTKGMSAFNPQLELLSIVVAMSSIPDQRD